MKCALCLTGYASQLSRVGFGLNEKDDVLRVSYDHYERNVFTHNKLDVFIHTWDSEHTKKYLELFQPKKYLIEKQIDTEDLWDYDKLFAYDGELQSVVAKAYAINRVLNLVNGSYDIIVLTRPDICWLKPLKLQECKLNRLYITNTPKKNAYYLLKEQHSRVETKNKNKGFPINDTIPDLVFIGSPNVIKTFGYIYENIECYLKNTPHGKYLTNHIIYFHHLKGCELLGRTEVKYNVAVDLAMTRHVLGFRNNENQPREIKRKRKKKRKKRK